MGYIKLDVGMANADKEIFPSFSLSLIMHSLGSWTGPVLKRNSFVSLWTKQVWLISEAKQGLTWLILRWEVIKEGQGPQGEDPA